MSQAKNNEVLLQADKLTRRFGGLVANQDISVTLERQMIHAEELHLADVDKMLRKPGELRAFSPHAI